jgi:hypothetical protein
LEEWGPEELAEEADDPFADIYSIHTRIQLAISS